jgi:hypothetical protein
MRKLWQGIVAGVVGLGLGLAIVGCGSATTGKDKMGDKMGGKMEGEKKDNMGGDKMDGEKMGGEKKDKM